MTFTLLSRAYCHLCDEMLAKLRPIADAYGAQIRVVDVDADPALEEAYGNDVPVLFRGDPEEGAELCRHRLDAARVAAAFAALAAAPAGPSRVDR